MFKVIPDNQLHEPDELHTRHPTYPQLAHILDDLPIRIALPDTHDANFQRVVAWVGDDYIARETRHEIRRNIPATVLLWALGAPRQPYAGPVALTGIHETILNGYEPISLDNGGLTLIETLTYDIGAILNNREPHLTCPETLRTQILTDAAMATEMQYESMAIWTHDQ